jgi:hypothetical protein
MARQCRLGCLNRPARGIEYAVLQCHAHALGQTGIECLSQNFLTYDVYVRIVNLSVQIAQVGPRGRLADRDHKRCGSAGSEHVNACSPVFQNVRTFSCFHCAFTRCGQCTSVKPCSSASVFSLTGAGPHHMLLTNISVTECSVPTADLDLSSRCSNSSDAATRAADVDSDVIVYADEVPGASEAFVQHLVGLPREAPIGVFLAFGVERVILEREVRNCLPSCG